ncbi:MAG: acylphosphatase [Candidatus Pacebacteria bacterium]|nr:acylphosphatase [Candidatus Paceibacterota bacterium]
MVKEIEVKVTGRVQMVMFRDFTMRKARGLGIVGTVQNMKDGSVHIVAVGEEAVLQEFLMKIHQGSIFSRVEDVAVEWSDPMHNFTNFVILYGYGE